MSPKGLLMSPNSLLMSPNSLLMSPTDRIETSFKFGGRHFPMGASEEGHIKSSGLSLIDSLSLKQSRGSHVAMKRCGC